MAEVMSVMPAVHLMINGRITVQQASNRIALGSARFFSEAEAIEAAKMVGLDESNVTLDAGNRSTTIDDVYRVEVDVSTEILRIKAAQRQVSLGVKLHAMESDLNDDVKGLLR